MDLDKIKSGILCAGLGITDRAKSKIRSKYGYMLDHEFAHGAYIMLPNGSYVNTAITEDFAISSPYKLDDENGSFIIKTSKPGKIYINLPPPQNWYSNVTPSGKNFCDIFQLHGSNTLFCKLYQPCDYHASGRECLFCKFPQINELEDTDFRDIQFVLDNISDDIISNDYHIALSGGTRYDKSLEYKNLNKLVTAIRSSCPFIPISVELAPPTSLYQLELLATNQINTIIMNIEFCDNEIRKIFLPEKSKIDLEHYLTYLAQCVDMFGYYNVGSVLIYGIEKTNNTMSCAKSLISMGIIPTIIPFRPYNNTRLRNFATTNPDGYFYVAKEVQKLIRRSTARKDALFGCLRCGGCSIELD